MWPKSTRVGDIPPSVETECQLSNNELIALTKLVTSPSARLSRGTRILSLLWRLSAIRTAMAAFCRARFAAKRTYRRVLWFIIAMGLAIAAIGIILSLAAGSQTQTPTGVHATSASWATGHG